MNTNVKYVSIMAIFLGLTAQLSAHEREQQDSEQEFEVKLRAVNNSGVRGEVEIKLISETELRVSIEASGLETSKPHPQHIHGFNAPLKKSVCPDLSNDGNGDGVITIGEAAPAFGPILIPLAPFDTVDANGEVNYRASFTINPDSLLPLGKRTVVLHGMTVNGQYIPSLPVACGEIVLDD